MFEAVVPLVCALLSTVVAIVAIVWTTRTSSLANKEVVQMCREALASGRVLPERFLAPQGDAETPYEKEQRRRIELSQQRDAEEIT